MNQKFKLISVAAAAIILVISLCANAADDEIQKKLASSDIYKAQKSIEQLSGKGLSTMRANDILNEANLAFSAQQYSKAILAAKEIGDITQKAVDISEIISSLNARMNESVNLNLTSADADMLLKRGINEFSLENYQDAQSLLENAAQKLAELSNPEFTLILERLDEVKNKSSEIGLNTDKIDELIKITQSAQKNGSIEKIGLLKKQIDAIEKSAASLQNIKEAIAEMSEKVAVSKASDLYIEGKLAFELGEYARVVSISEEVVRLKSQALEVYSLIIDVKAGLQEAGSLNVDMQDAINYFNSGMKEFDLENYEDAKEYITKCSEEIARAKEDALLFGVIEKSRLKSAAMDILKKYWWLVLVLTVLVSIAAWMAYKLASIRALNRRIAGMKQEFDSLGNLMKDSQRKYFAKKLISKDSYEASMDRCQERIIKIKETIPVLQGRIDRLKKEPLIKWVYGK